MSKTHEVGEGTPVRNLGGDNELAYACDIKDDGSCTFISGDKTRVSHISDINLDISHLDFTKTYVVAVEAWVGAKVAKHSGNPFKSGLKVAKVKSLIASPATGKPAFILEECGSCVECYQCKFVSKD